MKHCIICADNTVDTRRNMCSTCIMGIFRARIKLASIQFLGGKCNKCGLLPTFDNLSVFTFHHVDPSKKKFGIGQQTVGWDKQKAELKKCIVLCYNCHMILRGNKNGGMQMKKWILDSPDTTMNKEVMALISDLFNRVNGTAATALDCKSSGR